MIVGDTAALQGSLALAVLARCSLASRRLSDEGRSRPLGQDLRPPLPKNKRRATSRLSPTSESFAGASPRADPASEKPPSHPSAGLVCRGSRGDEFDEAARFQAGATDQSAIDVFLGQKFGRVGWLHGAAVKNSHALRHGLAKEFGQ